MKSVFYASVAVAALLVGSTVPSHANLMLRVDGGAPIVDTGGIGVVNFIGSVGAFAFNVTTGLSMPAIGTALQPILDLNSVDVTSTTGGTLTLELTDTDYAGTSGLAHVADFVGGTLSAGSFSVRTFMDCGNSPFAQTTALTSQSFSGPSFSGGQDADVSACSGAYSLTQLATLLLPGSSIFSGDSMLAVPEPATIVLFGAGLLGLAYCLRRRNVAI